MGKVQLILNWPLHVVMVLMCSFSGYYNTLGSYSIIILCPKLVSVLYNYAAAYGGRGFPVT